MKNFIWKIKVNEDCQQKYSDNIRVLSSDELDRYHSFKHVESRWSYLFAHVSLRLILSSYTGEKPENVLFKTNSYGKPEIINLRLPRFNISHSKEFILIIVSDCEVGVDVEYIKKDFDYIDIIGQFFSKKEKESVLSKNHERDKLRLFYKIWTQKEALLKCLGTGLVEDIDLINLNYVNESLSPVSVLLKTFFIEDDYVYSFAYQVNVEKNFHVKEFFLD